MDNTIIQQGRFTSTGAAKTLAIRSDVDWMYTFNYTQSLAATAGSDQTIYCYWQRGMAANTGLTYTKTVTTLALVPRQLTAGFTLIDSSSNPVGALNATTTAISNAAIPVVSNSGTNGLLAGDVVRIINTTGAQQLGGFDFTVGHNTLTSGTFSLDYMSQIVAGTTGSWRKISFDPLYYPRSRYITKITKASSAVVTLSVTHGYKVGQQVRFTVPAAYGMTQMDGLQGTITAIDTTATTGNTITVDIDSSAFTTFAFPLTAAVPFSPAVVVPIGEDTAQAISSGVDLLNDATINTGYIGIQLAGGAGSPAGANNDVIYWVAGKSFSVTNE